MQVRLTCINEQIVLSVSVKFHAYLAFVCRWDGEFYDAVSTVNSFYTICAWAYFLRVVAGNDATVAALGECWKGGGQGYKSMVLVTLGTDMCLRPAPALP